MLFLSWRIAWHNLITPRSDYSFKNLGSNISLHLSLLRCTPCRCMMNLMLMRIDCIFAIKVTQIPQKLFVSFWRHKVAVRATSHDNIDSRYSAVERTTLNTIRKEENFKLCSDYELTNTPHTSPLRPSHWAFSEFFGEKMPRVYCRTEAK